MMNLKAIMVVAFLDDGTAHQILINKNTQLNVLDLITQMEEKIKIHEPALGLELDLESFPDDMDLKINLTVTENEKKED